MRGRKNLLITQAVRTNRLSMARSEQICDVMNLILKNGESSAMTLLAEEFEKWTPEDEEEDYDSTRGRRRGRG